MSTIYYKALWPLTVRANNNPKLPIMLSPKKKKFEVNKKYQLKVLNQGKLKDLYTM